MSPGNRHRTGGSGRDDARDRRRAGDEIVEERALLNGAGIARARKRQIDRENPVGRVARMDALEGDERA